MTDPDHFRQLCALLELSDDDASAVKDWASDSAMSPVALCKLLIRGGCYLGIDEETADLTRQARSTIERALAINQPRCVNKGCNRNMELRFLCARCLSTKDPTP